MQREEQRLREGKKDTQASDDSSDGGKKGKKRKLKEHQPQIIEETSTSSKGNFYRAKKK